MFDLLVEVLGRTDPRALADAQEKMDALLKQHGSAEKALAALEHESAPEATELSE
jgi:hypothetical protein